MSPRQPLRDEDVALVKAYELEACSVFGSQFKDAADRFEGSKCLLERFTTAIGSVLGNGRSHFRAVDEAHNELCIAGALLSNPNPKFLQLEYEPQLAGCAKTIDFQATSDEGLTVFVDVKTIKPEPRDRWEQFERAWREGWLPKNANVMLSQRWLGGEFWHNMFTVRSRMLEHTVEFEQKIDACKLKTENTLFVLALCGEGFYWHEDELEDFASFYFSGSHRADDPLAKAEARYMSEKKIILAKNVSRFACMRRPQFAINYRRLNWDVRAPNYSSFR